MRVGEQARQDGVAGRHDGSEGGVESWHAASAWGGLWMPAGPPSTDTSSLGMVMLSFP